MKIHESFKNLGLPEKGVLTCGLLFLTFLPAVLLWQKSNKSFEAFQMNSWVQADCFINQSELSKKRKNFLESNTMLYVFQTEYYYLFNNQLLSSDKVTFDYHGSTDVSEAVALHYSYPENSVRKCFVNPSNIEQSVLKKIIPTKVYISAGLVAGQLAFGFLVLLAVWWQQLVLLLAFAVRFLMADLSEIEFFPEAESDNEQA